MWFLGALGCALLTILPSAGTVRSECLAQAVGYKTTRIGGRVVALWYPTSAAPASYAYSPEFSSTLAYNADPARVCSRPVPLVVFSHGDLGCGLQSVFFTEELARHGYVVAAPDHADAMLCHITAPQKGFQSEKIDQPPILNPGAWSDTSRADRAQDVEAVIDHLLTDSEFRSVIDAEKIGLSGHSLGGYTITGLAGGWPAWHDPRVKAVLAFSPYVMPFQARQTLGGIHVPLMYQGGTLDAGITPFVTGPQGAYAHANPPAYFLELNDAGHFAWVNCGKEHTTASCLANVPNARLIDAYGIAFFDRHLKNLPAPILNEKRHPRVASYEFK